MKHHLILLLLSIIPPTLQAQYQQSYQTHLDLEKLIIQFANHTTANQKDQILAQYPQLKAWGALQYPDVSIAITSSPNAAAYYQLKENLEQEAAIEYVGEYFKNYKEQCQGILNQVLVQLKDASDYYLLEALAADYQATAIVPHRMHHLYELHLDKHSGISVVDLAIKMHQSKQFVYAEPNYLLNPIVATNDPLYARQWAINNTGATIQYSGTVDADMDVDDAWAITTGAPFIKIAVMDSGVDTLHPDLMPNLLPGYSANGDGSKGYPTFTYNSDGHGTCCAGIIAAKGDNNIGTAGVAYDCKIVPVKLFVYQNIPTIGVTAYSTAAWMADGITWAWQSGKADILSNSWGLVDNFIPLLPGPGDTSTVNMAVVQAYANGRNGKGSLLFFSSGNDGPDPPIWPSREPAAIAVNATSMCDERKVSGSCDGESWEGNWGVNLELGAPGVKVATTDAVGNNGYNSGDNALTFNGTSAACPNAAGVMALILSVDSNLTAERARAIIDTTAEKVGGYAYTTNNPYGTWSAELGYGRVNAFLAVAMAQQIPLSQVDLHTTAHFEVYPNPSQGLVVVGHQLQDGAPLELIVYTPLGQVVQSTAITDLRQTELHLQDLPNGSYYISLKTTKTTVTKPLVLIR
ncbi:MAG: S8 family peptidase [Aureispira sp.]